MKIKKQGFKITKIRQFLIFDAKVSATLKKCSYYALIAGMEGSHPVTEDKTLSRTFVVRKRSITAHTCMAMSIKIFVMVDFEFR